MRIHAAVESRVEQTFRVAQIAGMVDLSSSDGFNLGDRLRHEFDVEVPDRTEPWGIGVIVGPSGSGKSTVAAKAFGAEMYRPGGGWAHDTAMIESVASEDRGIDEITDTLTAVGSGPPPTGASRTRSCRTGRRCGPTWPAPCWPAARSWRLTSTRPWSIDRSRRWAAQP